MLPIALCEGERDAPTGDRLAQRLLSRPRSPIEGKPARTAWVQGPLARRFPSQRGLSGTEPRRSTDWRAQSEFVGRGRPASCWQLPKPRQSPAAMEAEAAGSRKSGKADGLPMSM